MHGDMKLSQFIQNKVFAPRLSKCGELVIYDPETHYRQICLNMAMDGCDVIDASEGSIESRESALATLQQLRELDGSVKRMVV